MLAPEKANILLVDDQPNNLLALESVLRDLGQHLVKAGSGPEALRCLLNDDFALILLDVLMPGMDGFETAALIRQRDRSQRTPIIFLTAVGDSETHIAKGYSVGAVDYLFKPVVPEILRSKVSTFVELFRKTEEAKRQANQLREIEHREHQRKLAEATQRWEAERMRMAMHVAQEIQERLFPRAPPACAGFEIEGTSRPAEEISGDYFDYVPICDGSLGIVIGDVSGHGLGPALLMAATRSYLRALALTYSDVGEILTLANKALAADVADGRFVTVLLARLDPNERRLVYSSAGHQPAYILTPGGAVKAELDSTDVPLGVMSDGKFSASSPITLEPGELVVMLTDGIVEASDRAGHAFGVDRMLETVRANRHRPAREIVESLYQQVDRHTQHPSHADDLTAVVIKVQSP
ncbi:MAG TPA: SpoIIE family protein phosphatase [Pirellulales bacterium]|nr:SpoIIE family protein phosphatase [Pirellulales bacterium]